MSLLRFSFLKNFFLATVIIFFSACKKNEKIEKAEKEKEILAHLYNEEKEAFFFVATANMTEAIILKSQLAQYKAKKDEIRNFGRTVENNESQLLQEIKKIATKKLIILSEINNVTNDDHLFGLIHTQSLEFDTKYISSIKQSLVEQINLFESISKKTNDTLILRLVVEYLPKQYQLLREAETIKLE